MREKEGRKRVGPKTIMPVFPYSNMLSLVLLITLPWTTQQMDIETALKSFLSTHSSSLEKQQCYDSTWYSTGQDYVEGKWKSNLPPNLPALVFPLCVDANSFGNVMGMYYNEVSCAKITGSHFVMNRKPYPAFERGLNPNGDARAFFDALPTIVVNKEARNESEVIKALNGSDLSQRGGMCDCRHYCWTDKTAPWTKNVKWIHETARNAVDMLMKSMDTNRGAHVGNHDNSSISTSQFHPLIPDVVFHYRCGDNLRFGSSGYNLLSLPAIFEKIPRNASSIYIISDPVKRIGDLLDFDYSGHCHRILGWIHKNLTESFPNTTVLLRRGGDPYIDIVRIAYAKITICSASTFCFFAALGAHGKVYYPITSLIAKVDDPAVGNFTFQSIGLQFEWIDTPLLVFSIYRPWYSIEYALTGRPFTPEDQAGRVLQGNGRRLWFIYKTPQNTFKRRRIASSDVMESLGFHWAHIWVLTDRFINLYDEDPNEMKTYDDPTIKYHFDAATTRYWCDKCPPPYNTSYWSDKSHSHIEIKKYGNEHNVTADSRAIDTKLGPFGCRWKTPHTFSCN